MSRFLVPFALLFAAASVHAQPLCAECPERAPLLSEIASGDDGAESALADYVMAYRPDALSSTADLLRALALRDSVVARLTPRVEPWFFADEAQRYEQMEAFYAEAEALALQPVAAEGMLFGLTTGPLMDGLVTVLAPPDLVHFLDFTEAEGDGEGGEYPFGTLDPEIRMVLAGEALRREFPSSPYVGATQEAFSRALLNLASLHPVTDEDAGFTQWMVGVGTSEFYPWASDNEALQAFAQAAELEGSRYAEPFSRLLLDPPSSDGATLDVIVIGQPWDSREDAEARTLAHLDAGQDVAGPMPIGGRWHVVYRYYPTGDPRTRAAEDRADEIGLAPRTLIHTPEGY
ncbi:MAG: hypothetical protein AAF791_04365 [Bacteroidota bacterium]